MTDTTDIIYYNCNMVSSDQSNVSWQTAPIAYFSESRDKPIIKKSSQYKMSIVRFNMQTKTIPLFIPDIVVGQSNINLTNWQISATIYTYWQPPYVFGTIGQYFTSTKTVNFYPRDLRSPTPQPPLTSIDLDSTDYYYCYDYQHFCTMINNTFDAIYLDLSTQLATYLSNGGNPNVPLTTKVPRLKYDPTTNLFTLLTDTYGTGSPYSNSVFTNKYEQMNISFNHELWALLANFPAIAQGSNFYQISILNNLDNIFVPIDPSTGSQNNNLGVYWQTRQTYPSTSMFFNPVDSIAVSSSLLPNENELLGKTLNYGTNNLVVTATGNNFLPLISDYSNFQENAHTYNTFTQYVPSAEYRMIQLTSADTDIHNVDITLFWKNRITNQFHPIRLSYGASVSLKIMFRKDY